MYFHSGITPYLHHNTPFYDDNSFRKMLAENQIYSSKKKDFIKYLLLLAYNYQTNGNISYNSILGLTLEHIFPQSFNNTEWEKDLSQEELEKNINLLNSIGNLTLINQSLNSKLSNGKFLDKKIHLSKYCIWPLEREKYFGIDSSKWNEDKIIERAKNIANSIIAILPGPTKKTYNNNSNDGELLITIDGTLIFGKNQKEVYLNSLKHLQELTEPIIWKTLNIKGCADIDKN